MKNKTPDLRAVISAAMLKQKVSQADICRATGLHKNTISTYFGRKSDLRGESVAAILRFLKLKIK